MQAVLTIQNGPEAGRRQRVRPGERLRVGRPGKADWGIADDALLSDAHFAVECDAGGCRLRDLDSRFGTRVNHGPVTRAALRDGDRIEAGWTAFAVRIESTAGAERPKPVAPAPTVPTPEVHPVTRLLRRQAEPLYALLDAARDPQVLALLRASGEEFESLYEGAKGEELADFAPYLVRLSGRSVFLDRLLRAGWGQSWGVFLTTYQPFHEVRRHFRRFLLVRFEDGTEAYFRFYDPRVLRVYLPTCNRAEVGAFFGPIGCFMLESPERGALLRLTPDARGVRTETVAVTAAANG
jgi:pSer/pThr/pTyr-binding forkhead associated (FHA) protein